MNLSFHTVSPVNLETKSGILFLSICSLNKNHGGVSEYNRKKSITHILSNDLSEKLTKTRKKAFDYIKEGLISWQKISSKEFEHNQELRYGKEFGGMSSKTKYLPAIKRYNGRFFLALGEDRDELVSKSIHHILLMTGLYGLVLPFEPIQIYSCPINEGSVIEKLWKEENILTKILVQYVINNKIKRMFDLTAINTYRYIIDWEQLKKETNVEILHCHTKLGAGDNALIRFGSTLKSELIKASEIELLEIEPEQEKNGVLFRTVMETREDFPKEEIDKLKEAEREIGKNSRYTLNEIPTDFYREIDFEPSREISRKKVVTEPTSKEEMRMDWYLDFTHQFRKSITQVGDRKIRGRILESISEIVKDPFKISKTNKPLKGKDFSGKWSYRIGNYRLIHKPIIEDKVIAFLLVSPRGKVYDEVS